MGCLESMLQRLEKEKEKWLAAARQRTKEREARQRAAAEAERAKAKAKAAAEEELVRSAESHTAWFFRHTTSVLYKCWAEANIEKPCPPELITKLSGIEKIKAHSARDRCSCPSRLGPSAKVLQWFLAISKQSEEPSTVPLWAPFGLRQSSLLCV